MMNADGSYSPIIVIGAHRSGTTMLTKVLERFGVFMGQKKDANNEALFFQKLNRWMMNSVHAHWDYPQPFLELLKDKELKGIYVEYLRILLRSPRLMQYAGIKIFFRYGRTNYFKYPWGWKDPRNTFTLPVWLELFRETRVIHVRRHGVDVARSLVARNADIRKSGFDQFSKWRRHPVVYQLHPKKGGFTHSIRCNGMEGAFDIWLEYMEQATDVLQRIVVPSLDLYYERLLQQPEIELKRLLKFCGLEHLEGRIPEISATFDPQRAFAHRRNPEMLQFALDHSDDLTRFGYPEDILNL